MEMRVGPRLQWAPTGNRTWPIRYDVPRTGWQFNRSRQPDDDDVVGIGADLAASTLLAAYREAMFVMPIHGELMWFSPDPRAIIPFESLCVRRSLRQATRRFVLRLDTAFATVVDLCADPSRPQGWINSDVRNAYVSLHEDGWAHSVEAWAVDDAGNEVLAGGLYGVAIGGFFAGESMFHVNDRFGRDASKVALLGLIDAMSRLGHPHPLLDVQWLTPHLQSLGAVAVPRREYLNLLDAATSKP